MRATVRDRMILEKVITEEVTEGGIYLPDTSRESNYGLRYGIVILKGPKCDPEIREGDIVAFLAHYGNHYVEEGKKYVSIEENKILYYSREDLIVKAESVLT